MSRRPLLLSVSTLVLAGFVGCGGGNAPSETAEGESKGSSSSLPTASIGGPKTSAAEHQAEPGTPEWSLEEVLRIRREKLPDTDDVARLSAVRKERNEKIIALATSVIAATHKDPKQEELFVAGVHQMMEARLQLALQGDRDEIDALYADAESLQQKFPRSKAAAEAAFARVRFAHTNAQRFADQEPRWLSEFARQARAFAADFPEEETRATMLLHAAARSCELHRLTEEAVGCYEALKTQFPQHALAVSSEGAVRRLQLKGQPLQLTGPTVDGGFCKMDDFAGKTVLVCFWSTDSSRFLEVLPQIQAVAAKYGKYGFAVVGVNLDEEDAEVTAFLEQNAMPWPQILDPDPAKRRWDNPVVKHYGVRDIPTLWLVDSQGIVVETFVEPEQLDAVVKAQMTKDRAAKP